MSIINQEIDLAVLNVIRWMLIKNVNEISCEYSGGGDSGQTDEITNDAGIDLTQEFIMVPGEKSCNILDGDLKDGKKYHKKNILKKSVQKVIDDLSWSVCEIVSGGNGWVNDAGGSGSMNIKADGTLTINQSMNDRDTETILSEKVLDTFDVQNKSDDYISLMNKLNEIATISKSYPANEISICVSFSRGGDIYHDINSDDDDATEDVESNLSYNLIDIYDDIYSELMEQEVDEALPDVDPEDVDSEDITFKFNNGVVTYDIDATVESSEDEYQEWTYAKLAASLTPVAAQETKKPRLGL